MMETPRIGVVILDCGRPEDTARAVRSVQDQRVEARLLVVENGCASDTTGDVPRLVLAENRGFAGGMNAGLEQLRAEGCSRFLLLNNDAVLEPGCLALLVGALDDVRLAAVGPVILREADGRIESRGVEIDLRSGRMRLGGHGDEAQPGEGLLETDALSGAAMMVSRVALDRVGPLDEEYFFSFEETDWCLRARAAGFGLAVVLGARARHAGGQTIGRASPARLYYPARNHQRLVAKLRPLSGFARWTRRMAILALHLAHAVRQGEVPRLAATRAVFAGYRDARAGRFGPRAEERA